MHINVPENQRLHKAIIYNLHAKEEPTTFDHPILISCLHMGL